MSRIPADVLLEAYAEGCFPMAPAADSDEVLWFQPDPRGQLPILDLRIPARLLKTVRQSPYDIRIDTAFEDVIDACARRTAKRPDSWINRPIRDAFVDLFRLGYAHSVEAWNKGELVGGLYGLALGGAFCGESMFSTATDASKICLVHLCARLWRGGFTVLDSQYVNDHLLQFGAYEVSHDTYMDRLIPARTAQASFRLESDPLARSEPDLVHAYLAARRDRAG